MSTSDSAKPEAVVEQRGRRPQQRRGHARRQSLIDGAARVFEQVGYGEASLSDIVRESGASPGSLYFYFHSKDEIAVAIVQEQNSRTSAVLTEAASESGAVAALIRASAEIVDQLLVDPVVSAGIRLSLEQGTLSEPTADYYREWIGGVSGFFQRAIDEGDIVQGFDAQQLGRTLVPYFTGVHVVSNVLEDRVGVYGALKTMWRVMILAAVVPESQEALLALIERRFSVRQPRREQPSRSSPS